MDTPRPRSNSFSYNKVNRINIIQNESTKIKNSAEFLKILEKEASEVADGGSSAVKELCSVIDSAKINDAGVLMIDSNILQKIKQELINDANFYIKEIKTKGYCSDRQTISFMIAIFNTAKQLMERISPDIEFYTKINSYVNSMINSF